MPLGGSGGGGGSPAGWPLTFFSYTNNTGTGVTPNAANATTAIGFSLPFSLTFAHITCFILVADGANLYDFGIYNSAGTLVADIGAQHLPSTGLLTFATVQGSKTINAGLYLFGWTGNATTASLSGDASNGAFNWFFSTNVAASVGGGLPASIGAITPSVARLNIAFALS